MTYKADHGKAAYVGFSRGGSIAYEVTYWDRSLDRGHLALTIVHSGGMPANRPTPFFRQLIAGDFSADAFRDTHFFFYCGRKDEQWGEEQCAMCHNAEKLLQQHGAVIERFIDDPQGKHFGYRLNPRYHQAGIETFLKRTK